MDSNSKESKKSKGDTAYVHEWIYNTSTEQEAERKLVVSKDADDCLAARLYASCVQVLQGICYQVSDPGVSYPAVNQHMFKNELGRLYLFGDSFKNGKLNRILENADELEESIVEILAGIGILLARNLAPRVGYNASGSHNPRTQVLKELDTLLEQSRSFRSIGHATDNSDSEDEDDEDEDSSISEIVDLEEDLRSRVQMTLDLVPTLESTLEHFERLQKQAKLVTEPFYASKPASVYISLVRDKFPKADNRLIERLGEANWQRHVNIRKRMEQAAGSFRQIGSGEAEGTIAGSIFHPPTLFHDSGIGTTLAPKSQYAKSEASHTSFISSPADTERGVARVPPTPAEVALGRPFRCYLCGQMQSGIKHRVDWKCSDELRQFSSRKAWSEHELQEHRSCMAWACPECPFEGFTATVWSAHVQEAHGRAFAALQNSSAADAACRKRPRPIDDERCRLCNEKFVTDRDIKTHVGKHMEEVALMALPKEPEESSDDISNSDAEASKESGLAQGESLPLNSAYECSVTGCKQCFSTELERNEHALTHYQRPIVCNFCPGPRFTAQRSARGVDNFKQHLSSVHSAGARVSPESCVTSDAKTSNSVTNDLYDYSECPICESPFPSAQSLYKHLNDCEDYALTSPQALVSRWDDTLKTERYRPSPAKLQREFSRSSSLDVENDDRERGSPPCPGCGRFVKDLRVHMMTHKSEKFYRSPVSTRDDQEKDVERPYACEFCPRLLPFTYSSSLLRHLREVHGAKRDHWRIRLPASPEKRSLSADHDAAGKCSAEDRATEPFP